MDFLELSPKKRKINVLDIENDLFVNDTTVSQNLKEAVCVTIANSTTNHRDISPNATFLCRFLDRLKLRTLPLILPLLERLSEAENKNITALKSIDKINKRIKELESHVEGRIRTGTNSDITTGTDITDQYSDEYKRIMSALQSSPFAPFKPPTSQAFRQRDSANSRPHQQTPNMDQSSDSPFSTTTDSIIDLTSEDNDSTRTDSTQGQASMMMNSRLDIISAQFLINSNVTNLLSSPRLTWSLVRDGICLQWDLKCIDPSVSPVKYEISSFQKSEITLNNFPWRKIGEVAALPLPMACTLTYVAKMNTYFFAIRAFLLNKAASAWSNVIMVEIN